MQISRANLRTAALLCLLTFLMALACRLLEWPTWQNPEFSFDNQMLLATHDAYHWVAGACGFGRAVDHPMAAILRILSYCTGYEPANIAFWFPAVLSSLVGALVFLWAAVLGHFRVGIAAGLIACISPGFLGRTLLGFYDTDLVTLFFPLLITLPPALFGMRFLSPPGAVLKSIFQKQNLPSASDNPLSCAWLALLGIAGLLAWWSQAWHSVFPYLVRYNVFLFFLLIALLGQNKKQLFWSALAYALPIACGPVGVIFIPLLKISSGKLVKFQKFWWIPWLCIFALLAEGQILDTLLAQVNAYLKHSGDSHSSGTTALIFPSVAQSIIEVQDLSLAALFPYFHPWLEAAVVGLAGFILLLFYRPVTLYLLPLAILAILSSRLGGRMVMFGAPIVALGLAIPATWLTLCLRKYLSFPKRSWLACCALLLLFVVPFLDMIPAMSQGPILNRRHAAALSQAASLTPPDAILWLWWDWGYAAHYFARRNTIADGAMHGGPSLYLPAAVYATDSPRFARQIIKRCAEYGNEPGNFFSGLNAHEAQDLMESLESPKTPLLEGKGKQYLVTSFEMLKLGFWISNFGHWNFITATGEGGAISIIPEAVAYRLNAGEVRLEGSNAPILPTSINIFEETGVIQKNYVREWFESHPHATIAEQKAWLQSRRNINFLFNRVTDEKLAVDQGIYNSLMVQLLLCEADDPRIAPCFRLIYDNVFTRIYEVLP